MKIDFRGNNFIVFLNKKISDKINFLDKEELEDYFRNLFTRLKDIYDLDICGSYNIEVFNDNDYGVILSIRKDDIEYFEYYDGQIDMSIVVSKYDKFIYKLSGSLDEKIVNKCDLYKYNNDLYVIPRKLNFINFGYLIENSEIIYGKIAYDIFSNSVKISNKFYVC